ncbi:Putative coenzyme F420-dependent oxidoreductase [Zhongshania aliphaticivorans]|uniref:Coenzyme F420-dependent oxidoreductase n=1 Tax=Zhongshania aliphaticivorans TaxID=1470434 RepID=A0A5S9N982_9GAMM|nr:LLM class F420-dependent oxidoreductase [Zhongshania aliphaticivorans]CAA0078778.1 Putative coenzyme F420-dependent oxidoreductase [Zhongshania aliphaticivorans]CAA0086525.1 Putative coenzyme F420-dependent oxidoreductase [Zhongshania aliphaticivorans]
MKLGLLLGYSGAKLSLPMDTVKQAETLGFDSVWTAEAYGSDAVSPAAWILAQTSTIKVGTAIMQMPARTPAMCAMTAMSLDQLSGGRFIVGLGASGPQVVEGWHGVPYGKPVTRTREYIKIMKTIFERQGPVEFDGGMYQMPYKGPGATGLGKPLKSILHGDPNIPIYTASITPAGVSASAEVADGVFPVWMSPEKYSVLEPSINKGLEKSGRNKADFDVAPFVGVIMDDNIDGCRYFIKDFLALYIGGMGAKGKNFYTDYATRMGYGDAAEQVQDLYLAGKKDDARNAIPDALVDEIALVGPEARIRERAADWKAASQRGEINSMLLNCAQPEAMEVMADCFL